jgi:hypothetical protein
MYTKKDLIAHIANLNEKLENAGLTLTLMYGHRNGYACVDYRYTQAGFNTIAADKPLQILADKATIFAYQHIMETLNNRVESYGRTVDHLIVENSRLYNDQMYYQRLAESK